jgi:putative transposase
MQRAVDSRAKQGTAQNKGRTPQFPISAKIPRPSTLTGFMPRIARAVAVGLPHHVTQRGNNRRLIFDCDQDRLLYLKLLRAYSERHSLRIWGYCLMDNHVHLIVVPGHPDSLARTLRQTHADYARYSNIKRCATGHFWQNRYFSCVLDTTHCWQALAYIEKNPVRAGMVTQPTEWRWSSARAHLGARDRGSWLDLTGWRKMYNSNQWQKVLQTTVADEAQADRIRAASRTGRPLGHINFVRKLERRLQRRLTLGKPGRPPRTARTPS